MPKRIIIDDKVAWKVPERCLDASKWMKKQSQSVLCKITHGGHKRLHLAHSVIFISSTLHNYNKPKYLSAELRCTSVWVGGAKWEEFASGGCGFSNSRILLVASSYPWGRILAWMATWCSLCPSLPPLPHRKARPHLRPRPRRHCDAGWSGGRPRERAGPRGGGGNGILESGKMNRKNLVTLWWWTIYLFIYRLWNEVGGFNISVIFLNYFTP